MSCRAEPKQLAAAGEGMYDASRDFASCEMLLSLSGTGSLSLSSFSLSKPALSFIALTSDVFSSRTSAEDDDNEVEDANADAEGERESFVGGRGESVSLSE